MKKIIAFTFALHVAAFSNAQAPDSWTEKNGIGLNTPASAYMSPRSEAVAFTINGKGYIGTGYNGSITLNDFWEFDPVANVLTQKANVGGGGRMQAVGFSIGTRGYIGTGFNGAQKRKDFWEYDLTLNTWSQKADFAYSRVEACGFSIGSKGYIGTGYDTIYRNDFWEYNPATNIWTQKASLWGAPRGGPACFTIGTKGYIGTGSDTAGALNDFWEYDQAANTWTPKADFGGAPRWDAAGLSINGKGYIGTGYSFDFPYGPYKDFWEYNPALNTWTQKSDIGSIERQGAVGFSIGNIGYLGTGEAVGQIRFNDIWQYDPASDIWTEKINFGKTARVSAVGINIGNKGYIGTGHNGINPLGDFWQYAPATNTWIPKAGFGGIERSGAAGFSIGNKGYIGTGYGTGDWEKDFWEYDPSSNIWTQIADFGGTGRSTAAGFSIGNKGYIGTGNGAGGFKKDFWEYDPLINTWTQKSDFGGIARDYACGFSIGNKGYIGTGRNFISPYYYNDFWEYNPASDTWTQKANFGGVPREGAACFVIGSRGYIGTGDNSTFFNDFWEYNPAANSWIQRANFGGAVRYGAPGFNISNKGYICAGNNPSSSLKNDLWEYTPICTTPSATIYPSGNISFCNGDSVFLYANNSYNYQWKKNGVDITGATSYFYYAKTTGSYTCYLTNPCGTITSSAISVTVNSLPSATITPAGTTTFCSGGSVVLNVPSGVNKIYQWKKGVNLISGATLSSYSATTGGNYRVIVTNTVTGCSKTSGSATAVTVNALPAATITPQGPTTFCAGGSVVLAANTGAGLTYKWKKGSSYIAGATLSNYTATIGGNYRVQVTNSNGCSKTSALVAVSVPCKEGESVNVEEGESVFDVNVYPNPNSGEFTIRFLNKPTSPIQIELTDVIGKVVKRFETDDETIVIKESNLARGIYGLTARNNDKVVIKKINIVK